MTLPLVRRLAAAARVFALVLAAGALTAGTAACAGPEATVEQAVEAAARGDRARYVGAFTPRSRPLLALLFEVAAKAHPELGRLAARDVQVTGVTPLPPDAEGRERVTVSVREGQQNARLVLHRDAGAWRIDLVDTERGTLGFGFGF